MSNLPWGNNQNLTDDEFYNREGELNHLKSLLETTSQGHAPDIFLTGLRGVGKTVFLQKIKRQLDDEYLVIYLDFSRAECFQKNKMSITGLMNYFFKELMIECEKRNLNTLNKKIEKYLKTNDFKIKDVIQVGTIPIPLFSSENNSEKTMNFVFKLVEKIYNENKDTLKGIIIFIDEFQIIKDLNDYMESFLWNMRSYIQNQRNIAYLFSGSMSMQDKLISDVAGYNGVFGGRMLTLNIYPFDKNTVKNYLNEKAPEISFTDDGFERFYSCTSGIPSYINIFASLLPVDKQLNNEDIILEFDKKISAISSHLINIWTRLSYREQSIIVELLDKPLRRKDIADNLNISPGSLSNYLTKLQNEQLIILDNKEYKISEPILKRWLELEYKQKGVYPYRQI